MTIEKGMMRQAHRDRASYRRLTADGVTWIRERSGEGMNRAEIRDAFKAETGKTIGLTTIGDILSGKNWVDVS